MGRRTGSGEGEQTPRDPHAADRPATGDMVLVTGEGRLSSHELRDQMVIGRDDDCDIVIEHRSLSRRHALLCLGPPMTIQDLGSTNGTHVGRQLLQGGEPMALQAGDSIHIGPFTIVVVARSRPDDRSASGHELLRVADPTLDGVPAVVRELAGSQANVLILGETGVGKEVLAETIHRLSGRRGQLVRINCAALTEPLLESELFGHEKGAFTGAAGAKIGLLEAAQGGTAFLDEIGELPAGIQAKLLRAVEHREVLRIGSTRPVPIDVRFVAATNRDLPVEVEHGRFRRDLYFRLDGVTLAIPPLRERRGMVGPLALRFLDEGCRKAGRPAVKLRADVLAALEEYEWPGNVRELKAVVERAVLLARGADPSVRHLAFVARADKGAARPAVPPPPPAPSAPAPAASAGGDFLDGMSADERADRERLIRALEECAGNQTRAAKLLGISRTTLVNRVRLYRIPRPRS
ncbi:MAG TPA: sigma 54-interacting transcriptional regulator [Kofleriaceae bacterium]|nr:sigma 54-interacting transcriptional regulator [Kofleriaceae bacterium]